MCTQGFGENGVRALASDKPVSFSKNCAKFITRTGKGEEIESDLFEFGYEATGEVDAKMETFADWQKENDTGVVYYLRDGKVRGVMMCNVWDKIGAARELIKKGEKVTPEKLRGLIA